MNRRIIFLLILTAAPVFGQSAAPAKTYQWHHPWFGTEITSATPPTWPYRIIKEQNGVIQVEVAAPRKTAPESSSTEPKPARFRYIDPDTGKSVTSASPPTGYSWEKKRIEADGTVFLKITGRKFADRPAPPAPQPAVTIPAEREVACQKLGPFARAVAASRQRGVSLRAAEASIILLFEKGTTPAGLEIALGVVRSVYKNQLTTENAAEITISACKLTVFVNELEKSRQ